jgi:hypothetical protein
LLRSVWLYSKFEFIDFSTEISVLITIYLICKNVEP